MMILDLLAAATPAPPTRLEPVELFLDADIVVQAVMAGLLLASIWSWMIIISFALKIGGAKKRARNFEQDFWASENYEETLDAYRNRDVAPARIAWGAITEWKKSTKGGVKDVRGAQGRIAAVMDSHVAEEADRMAGRLTFLATLGSVAPFVGLFGTVWGIMNSFFQIGAQESSSLADVAPGEELTIDYAGTGTGAVAASSGATSCGAESPYGGGGGIARVPCVCGATCCRGFLPFDPI